jgi:hypothetical protein
LDCIGRLLALTDNNELNALASLRFGEWLGQEHVYQLAPTLSSSHQALSETMRGQILFAKEITFKEMERGYFEGTQVVLFKDNASEQLVRYEKEGRLALVLFVISNSGRLLISTCAEPLMPKGNQAAICLVGKETRQELTAERQSGTAAHLV